MSDSGRSDSYSIELTHDEIRELLRAVEVHLQDQWLEGPPRDAAASARHKLLTAGPTDVG